MLWCLVFSPSGNEALILVAANQGLLTPCLSGAILHEYAGVLARPKFAFAPDEITALIDMLRRRGEFFEPLGGSFSSPDQGDDKFLQCAEAAEAEFLITGNKRHFPEGTYSKTMIVSAAELLERITTEI